MYRYEVIIYWSDEDKGLKSFLRPIVLLVFSWHHGPLEGLWKEQYQL
jgi:hypothetical protein